jgi:hypothetical protein
MNVISQDGGTDDESTDTKRLRVTSRSDYYIPYGIEVSGEVVDALGYDQVADNRLGTDSDDEVVSDTLIKGFIGGDSDTYEVTGDVEAVVLARPDDAPQDMTPAEFVTITLDGEEIDLSTVGGIVESIDELNRQLDEGSLSPGGLLAILPGISPLSSTQTTIAAGLLALAIAGSVVR